MGQRGGLKSSPTLRSAYSRSSTPSQRRRATCCQEQGFRSRENTGSLERGSWSCLVAISCRSVQGSTATKLSWQRSPACVPTTHSLQTLLPQYRLATIMRCEELEAILFFANLITGQEQDETVSHWK